MAAKPTPERKASRSGSYVPDSIRDGTRLVIRCTEEQAAFARKMAERWGLTLAELLEQGIGALESEHRSAAADRRYDEERER